LIDLKKRVLADARRLHCWLFRAVDTIMTLARCVACGRFNVQRGFGFRKTLAKQER
jgi:hypothetical protein